MHRPNQKQHATCPSDVRERRHRHAKLDRAAKQASRRAIAAAHREGITRLGPLDADVTIVDEVHIWAPGWEPILGAILTRRPVVD